MWEDRPQLYIVAGPSGAGKSSIFNSTENKQLRHIDRFNIDDRLAQLNNGSYRDIPNTLRPLANRELADFINAHIESRRSFSTETTLRHPALLGVTERAAAAGFETRFTYVAAETAEIHIQRVEERALRGGHSAPPEVIRSIYDESTARLPKLLELAEHGKISSLRIYDNSGRSPSLQLGVEEGYLTQVSRNVAFWVDRALSNSVYEVSKLRSLENQLLSDIDTAKQRDRQIGPIERSLSPEEARQFKWVAETGTVQSYRHPETGRHIHIDGPTGQFYDQQRNLVSRDTALSHALPEGYAHSRQKDGPGFSR